MLNKQDLGPRVTLDPQGHTPRGTMGPEAATAWESGSSVSIPSSAADLGRADPFSAPQLPHLLKYILPKSTCYRPDHDCQKEEESSPLNGWRN